MHVWRHSNNCLLRVLLLLLLPSGALLMAPGLRYGRVLQGYLKPPLWARNFAGKVNFMQLLVRAGYLAQMLMLPLWVSGFVAAPVLQCVNGLEHTRCVM
jgi:hypothetical protein